MARSVATIQAQLVSFFAANNDLTYLNEKNIRRNITYNTSKRAFWNLLAFVVAATIAMLEQMLDLLNADIQQQVAQSAAVSALWIQQMMFRFQYDVNHAQILQLNSSIVPVYPTVTPNLQIIKACSVTVDQSNTVNIKVATGTPLQQLNSLQLQAAQAYINLIGYAGINYNVSSLPPDRIYIAANIYHTRQFTDSAVKASVIAAIQLFLQDISLNNFDGVLKVSDLEGCIRNVNGVTDVVLTDVSCRFTALPWSSTSAYNPGNYVLYTDGYVYKNINAISAGGEPWTPSDWAFVNTPLYAGVTPLVTNSQVINKQYQPVAGYIIPEDAGALSAPVVEFWGFTHFNVGALMEPLTFFHTPNVYRCKVANTDFYFNTNHWNLLGPAQSDPTLNTTLQLFSQ